MEKTNKQVVRVDVSENKEFRKLCRMYWKRVTHCRLGRVKDLTIYTYASQQMLVFQFTRHKLHYDLFYTVNTDEFLLNVSPLGSWIK